MYIITKKQCIFACGMEHDTVHRLLVRIKRQKWLWWSLVLIAVLSYSSYHAYQFIDREFMVAQELPYYHVGPRPNDDTLRVAIIRLLLANDIRPVVMEIPDLEYRMPNHDHQIPITDGAEAVQLMRAHATEWGYSRNRALGAIGVFVIFFVCEGISKLGGHRFFYYDRLID